VTGSAADIQISLDIDAASQRALERAMNALPDKVFDKVVKSAANAAMTPVLKAARAKCPVETKQLKASLGKKRKVYKRNGVVVVLIGPRDGYKDPETGRNPVNYAHLVEFGTAPHLIPAGEGLKIGPAVVRGTVEHPGAPAKPFLRPALDESKQKVLAAYRKKVLQGIERETAKLSKG